MSDAIVVAIISGVFSLAVGVISALIAARSAGNEVQKKLEISQAVTDTKLDELTREVRKHNNFAERIPVLEEKVKVANDRITDLEKAVS